jgi:hypothetical protein
VPEGAGLDRRTMLAALGGLVAAAAVGPSAAGAVTPDAGGTRSWTVPSTLDRAGLQDWADRFNGTWLGAWADDTGRTGTSEFRLAIAPGKRRARVSFVAEGGLFGTKPIPRQSIEVVFTTAKAIIPSFSGQVPEYGYVRVERQTTWGSVRLTTSPPKSSKRPQTTWYASLHDPKLWTIGFAIATTATDTVHGSAAWSRDRRPPAPSPAAYSGALGFDSAFTTGHYASSLLDAATLHRVLGADAGKPEDNGGNASFTPTMGASNARVQSTNYLLQFTVLRGKTEADAQDYFAEHFSSYDTLPELAPDATTGIGKVWVRRGAEIAEIEVTANSGGAGDATSAHDAAIAIGQAVAPKLAHS